MIPFILAVVGGYLIGDSMKDSEKFDNGGSVDNEKYQIKKEDGTYYFLKMSTGSPSWAKSPDMGYTFNMNQAVKLKETLEKSGYADLEIVKYNKDWWKEFQ